MIRKVHDEDGEDDVYDVDWVWRDGGGAPSDDEQLPPLAGEDDSDEEAYAPGWWGGHPPDADRDAGLRDVLNQMGCPYLGPSGRIDLSQQAWTNPELMVAEGRDAWDWMQPETSTGAKASNEANPMGEGVVLTPGVTFNIGGSDVSEEEVIDYDPPVRRPTPCREYNRWGTGHRQ